LSNKYFGHSIQIRRNSIKIRKSLNGIAAKKKINRKETSMAIEWQNGVWMDRRLEYIFGTTQCTTIMQKRKLIRLDKMRSSQIGSSWSRLNGRFNDTGCSTRRMPVRCSFESF
jgi:hypothetical protein